MPAKLKEPEHHTLADWDFEYPSYLSLASDYYVSAPTSLKLAGSPGSAHRAALCRIPGTLCLPQGEVRTWGRTSQGTIYPATFRNQAALGSSNRLNHYFIGLTYTTSYFYRLVNGVSSLRGTTAGYTVANQWQHHRIFWYNGKNPAEQDALCVDLYLEVAGEWVKQGSTMYDTDARWNDSGINRCGIYPAIVLGHIRWFDDTEIWGPV